MAPIAISSRGTSRPRFRYMGLAAASQYQQPYRDQHNRADDVPANAEQQAVVVDQQVGPERDQDDAGPQAPRPVPEGGSPPASAFGRPRATGWRSRCGRRWRRRAAVDGALAGAQGLSGIPHQRATGG